MKKKFLAPLVLGLLAFSIMSCNGGNSTNWAKYLAVEGGDVTVANGEEIEFINEAEKELPEGYSIVAVNSTTPTQSGEYVVTYAIVDANGKAVYQKDATYNVTVEYSGYHVNTKLSWNDEDHVLENEFEFDSYLWNSGDDYYLSIDSFGGTYQSFKVNVSELVEWISNLFNVEEESAATDTFVLRSSSSTVEQLIQLLMVLAQKAQEYALDFVQHLVVYEPDFENAEASYTIDFGYLSKFVGLFLPYLEQYGIIPEGTTEQVSWFLSSLNAGVTLSGYEVEGEGETAQLVGSPNAIKAYFSYPVSIENYIWINFMGEYDTVDLPEEADPETDKYLVATATGFLNVSFGEFSGTELEIFQKCLTLDLSSDFEQTKQFLDLRIFSEDYEEGQCDLVLTAVDDGDTIDADGYFGESVFKFKASRSEETATFVTIIREDGSLDPITEQDNVFDAVYSLTIGYTQSTLMIVENSASRSLQVMLSSSGLLATVVDYENGYTVCVAAAFESQTLYVNYQWNAFEYLDEESQDYAIGYDNWVEVTVTCDVLPEAVAASKDSALSIPDIIEYIFNLLV